MKMETQLPKIYAAKAFLGWKFTEIQAYLKKQEKFQIHNLNLPSNRIRKRTNEAQSQQKERNKIREELN